MFNFDISELLEAAKELSTPKLAVICIAAIAIYELAKKADAPSSEENL